ncbi:3,4-dihydroxy-2-butanone-4-phosphate synthase [Synchytrium microbalum]|uniref:3,4-dihydroxy-2-butanone 4-phosphate synthase n=1 Tax=Synchytrium microbalum TaxID=1806994 RepID=A0A507C403_9FUNG|nr:3,4-dihydroxy-2-butanone-4-phosphate synthase [Synchytrium microbalum]TPX35697.1 3,4-dihydroxy-2-butanone-4-phosphate synthase [Synchytrium microbalum]
MPHHSNNTPTTIVLRNVAYLKGPQFILEHGDILLNASGRIEQVSTTVIDTGALQIDGNGLLVIPALINASIEAVKLEKSTGVANGTSAPTVSDDVLACVNTEHVDITSSLHEAISHAIASGTTSAGIITSDASVLTDKSIQEQGITLVPVTSSASHDSSVISTGNIFLNSTSLWKELEFRTRNLLKSGSISEDALKSLFASVTVNPAKLLGLTDVGQIETGFKSDVIIVKLRPQWERTSTKSEFDEPHGLLLSLFLSGNDPSFIQGVFKNGFPVYTHAKLAHQLTSKSLNKYYEGLNLPAPAMNGEKYEFDSIEDAIADIKLGRFIIAVDNEDRENEGDLIIAAEAMTTEKMAFMIRYSGGVVCVPAPGEILDRLNLPIMVKYNEEALRTAYTITCDATANTTTGISAADRATTCRALAHPTTTATDFRRPGHVFPLRYHEGGVLQRVGHTEASVDLCKLAGLAPVSAISELVLDDGRMMRRDDIRVFAKEWGIKVITISDLVKYRVREGLTSEGW